MSIKEVYYEELKSKCVNGKWKSIRIGALAISDNFDTPERCLAIAKDFVQESLNKECGYDIEKNKEVKKMINEINKEVQCLLATL